jgi:hypothetical protein
MDRPRLDEGAVTFLFLMQAIIGFGIAASIVDKVWPVALILAFTLGITMTISVATLWSHHDEMIEWRVRQRIKAEERWPKR